MIRVLLLKIGAPDPAYNNKSDKDPAKVSKTSKYVNFEIYGIYRRSLPKEFKKQFYLKK
jgi:hypothetical protein